MIRALLVTAAALFSACGTGPECGPAGDLSAFPEPTVSFRDQVAPVLQQYGCTSSYCHGGTPPTSAYSLQTCDSAFGPGMQAIETGTCNVVPGKPDASYVIHKIEGRAKLGSRMPEGADPIEPADLAIVRQWILEGARNN